MTYQTYWQTEADTTQFAQKLAALVTAGDIICLSGDLGAGKTTFTRYFAQGLGVERVIKSPTYTIIREYEEGRLPLYHMDAYRLEETGAEGIGLEEYFDSNGVTVIEWPSFIREDLPTEYVWVSIDTPSATTRHVEVTGYGSRGQELVAQLEEK